MPTVQSPNAITFAVDDVTRATESLPELRLFEAVKGTLGSEIESCCDYHCMVIQGVGYQPLLAATYIAYSQHRPLVLSPDAVWLTIAQGVAHHMAVCGERLRPQFVRHEGRLKLSCANDWAFGAPENPWADAFDCWARQIGDHVGSDVYETLVCNFSTSGPIERSASHVVMMDIFERYFEYVMYGICGIPSISLEGTPADWQLLGAKAYALKRFDLGWWVEHLIPICEQFVQASFGQVNLPHWQSICKLREAYGGDVINGWIAKLFPYIRDFGQGPCVLRNPIFRSGEGITTRSAPSGLSQVPFKWQIGNREREMEAIGGLLGVSQNSTTFALRPKVGWAVREAVAEQQL